MSPEAFVHYKTNIAEIDQQHFAILASASEIARNKTLSKVQLSIELEQLNLLFINHLEYEEELMRKINYKYLAYHIQSHERLKEEFNKVLDNLKNPRNNKVFVVEKLDKVLLDHVDHDDMQYIQYYKQYLESLVTE